MRITTLLSLAAPALLIPLILFTGLAGPGAAVAQQAPMLGTWTTIDPATGKQEQLIITAEELRFGPDEPPLPYTATRSGDLFTLQVGDGSVPPVLLEMTGTDKATLTLPGTPPIDLTRMAAAPAVEPPAGGVTGDTVPEGDAAAVAGQGSLIDEAMAAMMPYGVTTRFEPLKESLEQLLASGWKLDQAGGAGGGFTLLLSKGEARALCTLVPKNLGQDTTALSDCRQLN